jgi:membrane-associated protease RseP (regulator of RpoE activity)
LAQPLAWPQGLPLFGAAPPLPPPTRRELFRSAFLFLSTAASVFITGGYRVVEAAGHIVEYVDVRAGLELAGALLAILFAHEMGHYLACRRYRVDSTLPYFIPAPGLSFVGTLGAFIRIRSAIPDRKALFDVGIAGPLAGFVVCLPVLVLGTLQAEVIRDPGPNADGYLTFGDPLLVQWAYLWLRGDPGPGHTFLMGPLATAAWFGVFVTALNMMPVGQLDGGHVTYALWPRHAHWVSRVGLVACLGLLYLRPTWMVWTLLLWLLARRPHPPTLYDERPIGRGRLLVGLLGYAIFAVCFTPHPIVISWGELLDSLAPLFTSR